MKYKLSIDREKPWQGAIVNDILIFPNVLYNIDNDSGRRNGKADAYLPLKYDTFYTIK